ncbi:MAG: TIGR04552 family protein [Myxococcota bacterium]
MVSDASKQTRHAFLVDDAGSAARATALSKLSLQDVHEARLLLRGDSVIDWHRLALRSMDDVRRLLLVNGLDPDRPEDITRLEDLRAQAVRYVVDTLGLRIEPELATGVPAMELPLLASGRGRHQRSACTLLKVMHIIYHLDARELRTALSVPDNLLYAMIEQSVVTMFDELRRAGVPVAEFSWSRKTRPSMVTKLLVKRDTSAARLFDRLRFRLVVAKKADLLPTLHVMLQRFIPFNYVLPGQTVNRLVDLAPIERRIAKSRDVLALTSEDRAESDNEFSGRGYQVLNFVADLPVRVDRLLEGTEYVGLPGSLVFVLAEFQILDRASAETNEQGESSHEQYKRRQHMRVKERMLREPKPSASERGDGTKSGKRRSKRRGSDPT